MRVNEERSESLCGPKSLVFQFFVLVTQPGLASLERKHSLLKLFTAGTLVPSQQYAHIFLRVIKQICMTCKLILVKMSLESTQHTMYWKNSTYLSSEQKGYEIIYNLKKETLQARHHVTLVQPYGEVDTAVVINPKKEGEQRDESRK